MDIIRGQSDGEFYEYDPGDQILIDGSMTGSRGWTVLQIKLAGLGIKVSIVDLQLILTSISRGYEGKARMVDYQC